jgi:hypothetical protein
MASAFANRMAYATISKACALAIKGIRHVNLSARRDDTKAEMAPQAYGGAVISCAFVLVKPTITTISTCYNSTVGTLTVLQDLRHGKLQSIVWDSVACKDHSLEVNLPVLRNLTDNTPFDSLFLTIGIDAPLTLQATCDDMREMEESCFVVCEPFTGSVLRRIWEEEEDADTHGDSSNSLQYKYPPPSLQS